MSFEKHDFQGVNEGYVLELYDRWRQDPQSVDQAARDFFATWTPFDSPAARSGQAGPQDSRTPTSHTNLVTASSALVVGAVNFAQSIRRYGHLAAQIDPLGARPLGDPALEPETHGVTEADLRAPPASLMHGPIAEGAATMWDVVERLRRLYCSTTGYDIAHIFVPEERHWLRDAIETGRYRAPADPIDPIALLDRLTDVEAFERFLHRTFPGKTRFSIEGLDMLVPILDEVIGEAAEAGMRQAFIGMAHRGRLNVMAHVLGQAVRADPRGVQGSGPQRARARRRAVERRREVPPRARRARSSGGEAGGPGRLDAAEPEPSRGDQSRCSRAWRARRAPTPVSPARRCSIPTPCCRS